MADDFTHEVTPSFEARHEMPLVAVPTPPMDGRSTGPWRPGMNEADLDAMPSDAVVGLMNVRRGLDPVSFEALVEAVAAWIETGTDHACERALEASHRRRRDGNAVWLCRMAGNREFL